MTPSDFRDTIRKLDLTETSCADFLNVGRRTIVRWVRDGNIPYSVSALLRLMVLLGIRPRELPKMIDDD